MTSTPSRRISKVALVGLLLISILQPLGLSGAAAVSLSGRNERAIALANTVFSDSSPKARFDQLSKADQAEVMRAVLPDPSRLEVTTTYASAAPADLNATTTPQAAAATTCWSFWKKWSQKSSAGNTLYTYWMGLNWCGSGGSITSSSVFDRGGETATPGWRYLGHGGSGSRNMGWEVRKYVQENFALGTAGWDVISASRCGQIRGGASGLYSTRQDCDL
jgi:hypothetical protein